MAQYAFWCPTKKRFLKQNEIADVVLGNGESDCQNHWIQVPADHPLTKKLPMDKMRARDDSVDTYGLPAIVPRDLPESETVITDTMLINRAKSFLQVTQGEVDRADDDPDNFSVRPHITQKRTEAMAILASKGESYP